MVANEGPQEETREPGGEYGVGDVIQIDDFAGVVVDGFVEPCSGRTLYIIRTAEGNLVPGFSNQVTAGQSPTRQPIPSLRVGAISDEQPSAAAARAAAFIGDERNDELQFLGRLAPLVEANAAPGSKVKSAFAELRREYDTIEWPRRVTIQRAIAAWEALPQKAKRKILNGWRPDARIPRVQDAIQEALDVSATESAERVLTATPIEEETALSCDTILTHGCTFPVMVHIVKGTTREAAVAALQQTLEAIEAHWERAIDLDKGLIVHKPEGRSPRPFVATVPEENTAADRDTERSQAWRQEEQRMASVAAV